MPRAEFYLISICFSRNPMNIRFTNMTNMNITFYALIETVALERNSPIKKVKKPVKFAKKSIVLFIASE